MGQPRILVVEDDSTLQYLMRLMAKRQGVDADVVASGNAAIKAIEDGPPYAVIFMDWRMPGMDGLECTRRIRDCEKSNGKHTPIIGITASIEESDRNTCLESGMDDFMNKPFGPDQFRVMLDRWLHPSDLPACYPDVVVTSAY
jgi:CheY-like chemotaxis protein